MNSGTEAAVQAALVLARRSQFEEMREAVLQQSQGRGHYGGSQEVLSGQEISTLWAKH